MEKQTNNTEEQLNVQTDEQQDASFEKNAEISPLDELKAQLDESKDKYLRLFAEFDNFKKRTAKEKLELIETASKSTVCEILPILDDFERAIAVADDASNEETISEGITMIIQRLFRSMENIGLKPLVSTGEAFDVDIHEALTEIPAPTEELKGKVVDTIQKGYFLKSKLIRHAKVVVGK